MTTEALKRRAVADVACTANTLSKMGKPQPVANSSQPSQRKAA